MNFYTLAARENKTKARLVRDYEKSGIDEERAKELAELQLENTFDATYRRAVTRMLQARAINEEMGLSEHKERFFMITVRPDENLISFNEFYNLVAKFVERKCIISYTLSFEQKGMSDETLGKGFHVHIIADMTQHGKAAVLRDTKSTFACCTAPNCVQVDWCRNPKEVVKNYLINYISKDEHKSETKEWDTKWREHEHLLAIYEDKDNLRDLRAYQVRSGPQIITLT